jgi:hypothetical protein
MFSDLECGMSFISSREVSFPSVRARAEFRLPDYINPIDLCNKLNQVGVQIHLVTGLCQNLD